VKIDRVKVLEAIKKYNVDSLEMPELKEALGGELLENVFDKETCRCICESFIRYGKFHQDLPEEEEDGIEKLENLLNQRITGSLESFYNIRPEYIASLPQEEQGKIAKAFSGSQEDLPELLMELWKRKIPTIACGGESDYEYILMEIPYENEEGLAEVLRMIHATKRSADIDFYDKTARVNVGSIGGNLYKQLLAEIRKDVPKRELDFYMNIASSVKDGIENAVLWQQIEDNQRYSEQSEGRYTEEAVEVLMADYREAKESESKEAIADKDREIVSLQIKLQEEVAKRTALEKKYGTLAENFLSIRSFMVNKLGRIPILGKRVLKEFEKELEEKALPAGEKTEGQKEEDSREQE